MSLVNEVRRLLWLRYRGEASGPYPDVEIWQEAPWTACRVRVMWGDNIHITFGHAAYNPALETAPFNPERGVEIAVQRAFKAAAKRIVAAAEAARPKPPSSTELWFKLRLLVMSPPDEVRADAQKVVDRYRDTWAYDLHKELGL